MNKQKVVDELNHLIDENKTKIIPTKFYPDGMISVHYYVNGVIYAGWFSKSLSFIKSFLPENSDFVQNFNKYSNNYYSNALATNEILNSIIEYIEKGFIVLEQSQKIEIEYTLNQVFRNFHRVVNQIKNRYDKRSTIIVEDEYDVQDLLRVFLITFFDDVRPEEWTPSYAGRSSRVDFLLKNEGIVIEVKMTRKGLSDKEVGEQLIIDIERYRSHPDCKQLICFVYDPDGRITNPVGLAKDLEKSHDGFVSIIIEPK